MAAVRVVLCVALLFCCTWGAPLISRGTLLGSCTPCDNVCAATYPLHTYPEEEELFGCRRGCRLFFLCQFTGSGGGLNNTKAECDSACTEAYPQSNEQYACSLGCSSQMPFAEKRQEQLSMVRQNILFPIDKVRSFWKTMLDNSRNYMTATWTFYYQAASKYVFIYEIEPGMPQVPQTDEENLLEAAQSDLSAEEQAEMDPWIRGGGLLALERENSILKCLAMNSNWLLVATLILSILVLMWIFCATVATAPDQHVPSEKLGIYGDLEYMRENKLKKYPHASLVVFKGLPPVYEEVEPLPTKVDLAKSDI